MPYQPLVDGSQIRSEFEDLNRYISEGKGTRVRRAAFCNALGRVGPPQTGGSRPFPWLTLVLGSETLAPSLRYPPEKVADRVAEQFRQLAAQNPRDELTEYDTRSVRMFILSLFNSRVGTEVIADEDPAADADMLNYPSRQLRLFHAAATLNATYFFTKAVNAAPVNRWEDEPARLQVPGGSAIDRDGYLKRRWDQASKVITSFKKAMRGDGRAEDQAEDQTESLALQALCDRILQRLGDDEIGSDNLLALTEAAWYFLTLELVTKQPGAGTPGNSGYLTWTDLLIPVGLQQQGRTARSRPSLTSPVRAKGVLRDELLGASRERARLYTSTDPAQLKADARFEAYQVYADILWAEAVVHHLATIPPETSPVVDQLGGSERTSELTSSQDATSTRTPPATAFVTTFDVELELAMRTYHPDTPIIVVLPMTLLHETGDSRPTRSSSLWMGYLIEPGPVPDSDGLLRSITEPEADKWFLLTSEDEWQTTNQHVNRLLGEAAIIVRLTGSPLVRFPFVRPDTPAETREITYRLAAMINLHLKELGKADAESKVELPAQADEFDGESAEALIPATVLEEHHALQLSFPGLRQPSQGLPPDFAVAPDGYWRFWAILGVQASNEAIRYRLIAQLIGSRISSTQSSVQPNRSGVAINSGRLSSRAIDLLQWSEFDVVTEATTAEATSAALQHYLRHLLVNGEPAYPVDTTGWSQLRQCALEQGEE